MSENNEIQFYAIAMKQGIGQMYIAEIPVGVLARTPIMQYPEDAPSEERAQRTLIVNHAKGIRDYVLKDINEYILPALTASIVPPDDWEGGDEDVPFRFEPFLPDGKSGIMTLLEGAKLLFNDGQHRHNGLIQAYREDDILEEHSVAVLLIAKYALDTSQYAFLQINSKQRTVPKGLKVVYDWRDATSKFLAALLREVPILQKFTDREKTCLSGANPNLFCLSHLKKVIGIIREGSARSYEDDLAFTSAYFNALTEIIPHWKGMLDSQETAKAVREFYVSTQGVTLEALANIAARAKDKFTSDNLDKLPEFLAPLKEVDWVKNNPDWDNRIVYSSVDHSKEPPKTIYKMLTKKDHVTRMVVYLKVQLKMPLTASEQTLEESKDPSFAAKIPIELKPNGQQTQLELGDTKTEEPPKQVQTPKGQRKSSSDTNKSTNKSTTAKTTKTTKTTASNNARSKKKTESSPQIPDEEQFMDDQEVVRVTRITSGTPEIPKRFANGEQQNSDVVAS